ncbi:MAG TPA: hypothetical protein VF524_00215 [Polyangia bacterium]
MAKAFVKDLDACSRTGYPIVTIVTPVLERRLQRNQRTPGIGLVRFLGPSDEQPFAAIAVDWGGQRLSSASKRRSGNSRLALLNGWNFLPKETFSFAEARTAVRPKAT